MNNQPFNLTVEPRTIQGRKVKQLRQQQIVPANIYGSGKESEAVQIDYRQLLQAYQEVGYTGLITITVKGAKTGQPVLLGRIQQHPITDQPIHADFRRVNLKQKMSNYVPLEIEGEPVAVREGDGILVTMLHDVEVEALPQDFPEYIVVNVESLAEVDDAFTVADIKLDNDKVKILTDPETMIAKIEQPTTQEELEAEAEASEGQKVEIIGEEDEDETTEDSEKQDSKDKGEGESKES